jgi:carbonic anhydrase
MTMARNLPGLLTFALVLLTGTALASGQPLATDRHVHGVITAVDPAPDGRVTITSAQHTVTGKIDPVRTKVTINGKAAKLADLKVSGHAKAELCLDDVWVSIDAHAVDAR